MIEPANHAGVADRFGDTWVRVDELPGQYGTWWPVTDGPGWETWGRNKVGTARPWLDVEEYGPLTPADAERTAYALGLVRNSQVA